jgi:hypothetical protein
LEVLRSFIIYFIWIKRCALKDMGHYSWSHFLHRAWTLHRALQKDTESHLPEPQCLLEDDLCKIWLDRDTLGRKEVYQMEPSSTLKTSLIYSFVFQKVQVSNSVLYLLHICIVFPILSLFVFYL